MKIQLPPRWMAIFAIGLWITLRLVTPISAEIIFFYDIALFEPTANVVRAKIGTNGQEVRLDYKTDTVNQSIIFRQSDGAVMALDHHKKTYYEIQLPQIDDAVTEAELFRKRQEKMVAKDDEDLEQVASESDPKKNLDGHITRKVKLGVHVERWVCDKYAVYYRMQKRQVLWTTTWGQLGVFPQQLKIIGKFNPVLAQLLSRELVHIRHAMSLDFATQKYQGFPIKTFGYQNGAVVFKAIVKDVMTTQFNNPYYQIPEGYSLRS